MSMSKNVAEFKSHRRQTNLVRGGIERSHFDELAESMFLTSSYAYRSAEQAARAFKGEEEHYLYSRYGNPTVTVFENRMKMMEGAASRAITNNSRTMRDPSPMYFCTNSAPETRTKVQSV